MMLILDMYLLLSVIVFLVFLYKTFPDYSASMKKNGFEIDVTFDYALGLFLVAVLSPWIVAYCIFDRLARK